MYQVQRTNTFNNLNNSIATEAISQRVQLYLSARNLLDMDFFSKSDPYVKVYFKVGPQQAEKYLGKTETIDNNLNPNFNKTFIVDYIFETHQQLRFEVYDEDENNNDDFIGSVTTSLGAVAGAKSQTLLLNLQNKKSNKKAGKLIIRMQPCQQCNLAVRMKWRANKLMNTDSWFDFWDKSDPYLKFMKIRSDNSLIEAGRTEIIMDNLNPNWNIIQISKNRLVSQHQNKIKIQCWDWEEEGEHKHQFIGQIYIELDKLTQGAKFPIQFPLVNRKYKKPGFLILEELSQVYKPTFLDYIRGGLQLNLSIAIDFTGSNGIPTQPSSLHYINPARPNQYQMAINAVARILLNYDTDQRIPCFGFGAKPGLSRNVSHCFPLSGNPEQTEAFGLEHLMDMYNKALMSVQFSGPTYFAPIFSQAIRLAQHNAMNGSNTYQILLVMTDGQIHDMDATINLLVENCNLPLSIIIVGVGNADFTNMEKLDGDNGLYNSKGRRATRDIVQFVPFRDVGMNSDLLAKELLAELPNQVTSYMGMIGKMPNPLVQVDMANLYMSNKGGQIFPQQALQRHLTNIIGNGNYNSEH